MQIHEDQKGTFAQMVQAVEAGLEVGAEMRFLPMTDDDGVLGMSLYAFDAYDVTGLDDNSPPAPAHPIDPGTEEAEGAFVMWTPCTLADINVLSSMYGQHKTSQLAGQYTGCLDCGAILGGNIGCQRCLTYNHDAGALGDDAYKTLMDRATYKTSTDRDDARAREAGLGEEGDE